MRALLVKALLVKALLVKALRGRSPAPLSVRTPEALGLSALFLASGTLHLVRPQVYEGIVPPWLPDPRAVVYLSGVAELVCAAALVHPRARRFGGYASAALLVAVFPANVQMALDAHAAAGGAAAAAGATAGSSGAYRLVAYARLPLQLPLIWVALRAAGRLPAVKAEEAPSPRPLS